jgi:hypothetical protein
LLKRIENIEGKTSRDYELGFVIQSFDTIPHFGRSVPVEKLDEVFGELTEKELALNRHPLVVDNLFCKSCEERLAKIESEYAPTLQTYKKETYSSGVPSEIGLLFWMSVIWRISINQKSGVQLTKSQNEGLRRILNLTLREKVSEIDFANFRNLKETKRISYRLIRCPEYSADNGTHMVWHPLLKHPYSLIIDEYLLFFAFKDNYNDFKRTSFFGMNKEIWEAPINKFNETEKIRPINEEQLEQVNLELIREIKIARVRTMNLFWDKLHVAIGGLGRSMPERIKHEIFDEIASEEKKMGRKYNLEDLKNSTYKVLRKYVG